MGAQNCKRCGLESKGSTLDFQPGQSGQQKYGTSGVEPPELKLGSRSILANSSLEKAVLLETNVQIPAAASHRSERKSIDPVSTGTVGSGDAAGGTDKMVGVGTIDADGTGSHQNVSASGSRDPGNGQMASVTPDAGGGAIEPHVGGSYSTTYFGREAQELQELPLPPGGADAKLHKRHVFHTTKATYDGQWLGNRRDGYGTQRWPDGAEFQGQWQNNAATGKGLFRHSDGSVYVGDWKQNIAHGLGIYRHKDGTTYEGSFSEDLQDGQGVESWPDRSQFVGQFKRGKKSGYGEYIWPDGSSYAGQWRLNQIDGIGSYVGSDGRRFDGSWTTSMMHGYGRYVWPDGRVYGGQYIEDQKDGFGIFTWADGRHYAGYWEGGRQHGLGRICQEGGGLRLAEWENGQRVGWLDEPDGSIDNPSLGEA